LLTPSTFYGRADAEQAMAEEVVATASPWVS